MQNSAKSKHKLFEFMRLWSKRPFHSALTPQKYNFCLSKIWRDQTIAHLFFTYNRLDFLAFIVPATYFSTIWWDFCSKF